MFRSSSEPRNTASPLFQRPAENRWLRRIRDNARMLVVLPSIAPHGANGAPLRLLEARTGKSSGCAQGVSLFLHATAGAAVLLVLTYGPVGKPPALTGRFPYTTLDSISSLNRLRAAAAQLGRRGGGGEQNPTPATKGNPAPFSHVQLLAPRVPDHRQHPLTAQPTIRDDQAPELVPVVTNLGLLTASNYTNSAGPGRNGIGNRGNNGIGDLDGDGSGVGNDHGPYRPGVTPVQCAYCPEPLYTDEARKAKLQGTVTLRVLVGRDGRASEIRISGGLGLGLDERAVETVRTWRFVPAKDAAHNPVPNWVTIETVYRLF